MSANAATWRTLTADGRAGWSDLGNSMIRTDSLGQTYNLTGFQAFCSVNNNLVMCSAATITAAPVLTTPAALLTATITTTGGTLSVAYTPTPLAASTYLAIFASPQRSAGRAFEGDFRLILVTAAAAASPANPLTAYTSKFGAPLVGNRIFFSLVVITNGFESGPLITSKVVTA